MELPKKYSKTPIFRGMEITDKELKSKLYIEDVRVTSVDASLSIDTEEFYLDASFDGDNFSCSVYIVEDEVDLTENQKDTVCNLLGKARDMEFETNLIY